ncbi:hypothetical protein Cgig2_026525 [Carnegiea gigantea]|uniref:CTLH domain-containing protein n=1 Tax=Carnegiea gigantea TaxID=171969 RepID=A0A9Q1KFU1_9CARY|nr:hypothetical protein Cgig2_026525 [Carnegiea gigantea]
MEYDPRLYEQIAVSDNDTHNIVLSYLVHNCFKETVESFICSTGIKKPGDCLEDIDRRKSKFLDSTYHCVAAQNGQFNQPQNGVRKGGDREIRTKNDKSQGDSDEIIKFALDGNALKAIELTEQLAADLLEKNKDLHFELLSLHFIELVRSKRCTEALEFAQKNLSPFGKVQTYVKKLEDLMALLAYEEPEKSPMFHLFSLDRRQLVADDLNRAILAHMNQPRYSSLERLIQQTTAVDRQLNQEHGKEGQSSFSLEEFVKKKNRTNTPEIPSKGQKQDA